MSKPIKYLLFKGIEKKEQILFRSFFNLVKNESSYRIAILTPRSKSPARADMLIRDENYDFTDDESTLLKKPAIVVGNEVDRDEENYIYRPVQWSDFRAALNALDEQVLASPADIEAQSEESVEEEIAEKTEFDLAELSHSDHSLSVQRNLSVRSEDWDTSQYDIELKNTLIDDQSVTIAERTPPETGNGEDREQKQSVQQIEAIDDIDAVIMDDESGLSTDTANWQLHSFNEATVAVDEDTVFKEGLPLTQNDEYWLDDTEIIINNEPMFYFMSEREMVYSEEEPGDWSRLLASGEITKLKLQNDWKPSQDLTGHPVHTFLWSHTYTFLRENLTQGIDADTEYLLREWPSFDLLELDNELLKLSTLLFVHPQTISMLVNRSECEQNMVVGFANACHALNLLSPAADIVLERHVESEEGMLNKIKDIFR